MGGNRAGKEEYTNGGQVRDGWPLGAEVLCLLASWPISMCRAKGQAYAACSRTACVSGLAFFLTCSKDGDVVHMECALSSTGRGEVTTSLAAKRRCTERAKVGTLFLSKPQALGLTKIESGI